MFGGGTSDGFLALFDTTKTGDASLVYATFLGGDQGDGIRGLARDSAGNVAVMGWTASSNFPAENALQTQYGGGETDAFVAKLKADGSALIYSTFLGGSEKELNPDPDYIGGIAVDSTGNAYVSGYTSSTDFPTQRAWQPTNHSGRNGFVAKIATDGSALVYSTYLGGTIGTTGAAIAVDGAGNAYVTGITSGFFPVANAFQSTIGGGQDLFTSDAFVTKFGPDGEEVVYSSYLGGVGEDLGLAIAVDGSGNALVAGYGASGFPILNPVQPAFGGGGFDAFIAKVSADADRYSSHNRGGPQRWPFKHRRGHVFGTGD